MKKTYFTVRRWYFENDCFLQVELGTGGVGGGGKGTTTKIFGDQKHKNQCGTQWLK